MKSQLMKPKTVCYLSIFLVLGLVCFSQEASHAQEAGAVKSEITSINAKPIDGAAEIHVDGSADFNYKLYKTDDPFKVVVELQKVDISRFTDKISVEEGGVVEIIPSEIDADEGLARLEIILSEPALEIKPLKQDNSLILMVAKPSVQPEDAASAEGESGQEAQAAEQAGAPKEEAQAETAESQQQAQAEEPEEKNEEVQAKPITEVAPFTTKEYVGKLISLDFQDAELVHIFRLLSDVSGYNIIVHPEVKGKVPTLKLINIPWDQAMDVILKNYGLDKQVNGNIIRIAYNSVFAKEFDEKVKAQEAQKKAEPLISKVFRISYADVKQIYEETKKSLSERGYMSMDERTKTLIVNDIPAFVEKIEQILETMDIQIPQVLIEARIVQVDRSFQKTFGIQWGVLRGSDGGHDINPNRRFLSGGGVPGNNLTEWDPEPALSEDGRIPLLVGLPAAAANSGIQFGFLSGSLLFGLDARLTALENANRAKILSTPKVLTTDNKEAELKQGLKVPYPVQSEDGVSTAFADVTTTLTVTPHITPDGAILLDLETKKSDLLGFDNLGLVSAPRISDNSVTTQVLIRNGDTVVIGGMYKEDESFNEGRTPMFHKIPIIGEFLFKNRNRLATESEILFFITPRIVREA
ncbi:MAG TPA: type IV pilus secretin PilQ [Thermodesulfovibrionia bacterium]|nr:type IV pilus secretin PilQ [Thermodesulfovibrionia bacterium]